MFRYVLITCITSSFIVFTFGGLFTKGKIKVNLEKAFDCKDESPIDQFHITVAKCNKTHKCLDVNLTISETWDSKSSIQLMARKWNAGGWANNAFNVKLNDACKNLDRVVGKNFKVASKEANFTCPAKPGTYVWNRFFFDFGDVPIAVMVGKYEIKCKVMVRDKLSICHMFLMNVQNVM